MYLPTTRVIVLKCAVKNDKGLRRDDDDKLRNFSHPPTNTDK